MRCDSILYIDEEHTLEIVLAWWTYIIVSWGWVVCGFLMWYLLVRLLFKTPDMPGMDSLSIWFYSLLMFLGYLSYRFEIMHVPESCLEKLKVSCNWSTIVPEDFLLEEFRYPDLSSLIFQICIDVEHAKCSICLNIWHDVVTAAPCLHNFWLVAHFLF